MARTIGYIVGSISSTSINRRLAKAIEKLAPADTTLVEIPIADLPFYSADHDANYPAVATDFKNAIEDADGVIILTPEYSRSVPGVLKNALDWAARPWGENSFTGKPVAIIGGSVGAVGTGIAQQHLRTILGHLDAPTLGQPEAFIHITDDLIDDDFAFTNEGTKEFVQGWLDAALAHVEKNA